MSSLKGERIFQEVVGLFLLAITIFLFLSLISYSKTDPCVLVACGGNAAAVQVSNYAGSIGANVSAILISFWGITAFFLPVITLFIGVNIMIMKPICRKWTISFGVIALLFATPPLISLLCSLDEFSIFRLTLAFLIPSV